jgi:hypothetical protein
MTVSFIAAALGGGGGLLAIASGETRLKKSDIKSDIKTSAARQRGACGYADQVATWHGPRSPGTK